MFVCFYRNKLSVKPNLHEKTDIQYFKIKSEKDYLQERNYKNIFLETPDFKHISHTIRVEQYLIRTTFINNNYNGQYH